MSVWKDDIAHALANFITVSELAGDPLKRTDFKVEYLGAPHQQPSRLPKNHMAVYAFWWNGIWLKVGKVGPKSQARYISQHYNPGSSRSNLAASLLKDPGMSKVPGFTPQNPGKWIKTSTCRVNILMPSARNSELLSLLESFLHVRLNPRYEG